jgi:23S rRNA-/tRNA-specific pseudouridylate synthase
MSDQPQAAAAEREQVVIQRPKRSVKGVASRTGPLNEEVSRVANVSLEDANELIKIGAVWARMETLTEQDLLSQYGDEFGGTTVTSTSILYSDFPSSSSSIITSDEQQQQEVEDLDDYVERMEAQRYRRILTPSVVEGGTDIRVYPQPRRFPSCYQLTEERLLYEDTTFIVVDKPPMLPTQVCTTTEESTVG